jgi:DNA repair protein RadD
MNLRDDDIMGLDGQEMIVRDWAWRKHVSRTSGKEMLAVTYYGENLSDKSVTEYFPVTHEGYAGEKARRSVAVIANQAGSVLQLMGVLDIEKFADGLSAGQYPQTIEYRQDGKFFRVVKREWA